jgi:ABC-type dipeptide/oligopeptide/nickel transport system permease component
VTLVFASLVVFAVLDLLPGNAAQVMLGRARRRSRSRR